MNTLTAIQQAMAALLKAHPGFPPKLEILTRRDKELANNIEAQLSKFGICLHVLPPIPLQAYRDECNILFIESSECRVRIIEQPIFNSAGFDVWDAFEQVAIALQGTNPGNHFAAPIGLARHPLETIEGKAPDEKGGKPKTTRVFDVIFDGAFQLNIPTPP